MINKRLSKLYAWKIAFSTNRNVLIEVVVMKFIGLVTVEAELKWNCSINHVFSLFYNLLIKPMKIKFKGEKYFKGVFVNFRPILSS